GRFDRTLRLWDVASRKELRRFGSGRLDYVCAVAFSPRGDLVASGGVQDDAIRLWDPATGKELRQLQGSTMTFSPDGRILAATHKDGYVRLWDPATAKEICRITAHKREVASLDFSPVG